MKNSLKFFSKIKFKTKITPAIRIFCKQLGIKLPDLYVNPRERKTRIFLNISYAKKYEHLRISLTAVLAVYGLHPVLVKNIRYNSKQRLTRIIRQMLSCKYAITDLSDTKAFNMPFELALLLTCGLPTMVFEGKKYWHQKYFSDILGCDPESHDGGKRKIIHLVSEWIWENVTCHRFKKSCLHEPLNQKLLEELVKKYELMLNDIPEEQIIKIIHAKQVKDIIIEYQKKNLTRVKQAALKIIGN